MTENDYVQVGLSAHSSALDYIIVTVYDIRQLADLKQQIVGVRAKPRMCMKPNFTGETKTFWRRCYPHLFVNFQI